MISVLKKYWWLIALTIAVLIFKLLPDKLPFLEKIDAERPVTSSNIPIQQNYPHKTDEKPATPMSSVSNFPQWVAEQFTELKNGVTLAHWRKNHSSEIVLLHDAGRPLGINIDDNTWCARTELSVSLPDGKGAIRYAIFYPPVAPATLALPDEDKVTNDFVDNNCALGLIWIQQNEDDETQGNRLALLVREAMDQRFGKGQSDIPLKHIDAKYMSQTGRWQINEALIISAYDTFPVFAAVSQSEVSQSHIRYEKKKILAMGYLPLSGFQGDGNKPSGSYYEEKRENKISRIQETVKIADISRQDGDALLSYFPSQGGTPVLNPTEADKLVQLLEKWVTAAEKLTGRRRAGALIVADQVLDHMQHQIGTTSIEKGGSYRQRLEKLGAKFFNYELERSYLYDHSWLETARTIDADGPMGDLTFRLLLEMGCSKYGRLDFQDVIKQGEEYLLKDHNALSKAEVELMVAEAYRDIVALSLGAGEGVENRDAYKEQAIDARQKAIMHYKNALPLLNGSTLTRGAWQEAWRLTVGLPPAELRYYCVYD
jgi:hypothetical protein